MTYQDIAHHYEDDPEDPAPPAFARCSEHIARKVHGCSTCEGAIRPGQRYEKVVMLGEEGLEVYRSHTDRAECDAARQEAEAEQPCEGR